MELRCLLRFDERDEGTRAILDARSEDGTVTINMVADGEEKVEALDTLAARSRDLFGAVSSVVETVEELARTYAGSSDDTTGP